MPSGTEGELVLCALLCSCKYSRAKQTSKELKSFGLQKSGRLQHWSDIPVCDPSGTLANARFFGGDFAGLSVVEQGEACLVWI
jgi:hypothetical protein